MPASFLMSGELMLRSSDRLWQSPAAAAPSALSFFSTPLASSPFFFMRCILESWSESREGAFLSLDFFFLSLPRLPLS